MSDFEKTGWPYDEENPAEAHKTLPEYREVFDGMMNVLEAYHCLGKGVEKPLDSLLSAAYHLGWAKGARATGEMINKVANEVANGN